MRPLFFENFRGVRELSAYKQGREGGEGVACDLEEILSRYGGMMDYVIRGILPQRQEAEECLAEVRKKLAEGLSSYDPERGSLATWITAVCRHAAIDHRRSLARRREAAMEEDVADSAPGPEDVLLQKERALRLRQALMTLSERDRRLFYRKYYYLQSTAQLAAELGTTERAVEGKLYRIRKRLQRELGGEMW